MKEEWKPIIGFEEQYAVSNLGNVKSLGRKIFRGPKGCQTIHEKILKPGMSNYFNVSLWKEGKVRVIKIHRLVGMAFVDNPDKKPEINHIDGDKFNNKASNLEWFSRQENVLHSVENGLALVGENHKNHKLTKEQVKKIRNATNQTQKELAMKYGCSQSNISQIKNNKRRNYG